MSALGDKVRAARMSSGLGLREAARLAGISPTYLSRVETGAESSPPAADTLERLAGVVGADPVELLCLAGKVPPDVAAWICSDPEVMRRLRREAARGVHQRRA